MADAQQGWAPLTDGTFRTPLEQTLPPPSPAPPASDIRVGANGYVHGVDGMLDQIASALARHAGPMLVRDVLPTVQSDTAMQARIGQAAGTAIADRWRPWIILGASALGVLAIVQVVQLTRSP